MDWVYKRELVPAPSRKRLGTLLLIVLMAPEGARDRRSAPEDAHPSAGAKPAT